MGNRSRLILAAAAAASVLAVGAVAGVILTSRSGSDAGGYRGNPPPPGIMLGDFDLRDYTGVRLSRNELEGKVVLLTFLESKCKEACPIIATQVALGLERLAPEERKRVVAIAISTHPVDDTPANVRAFLRSHGAQGKLHYLIGSERELRPIWERFGILSALDSGDADTHSASVHVYDLRGEWVSSLHPGIDLTPENLAHDALAASKR